MKSDRRHELEKNVLADRLGTGIQAAQPMMPLILGGIAIVVVGSLGWAIYSANAKSQTAAAWTDYYFKLASRDPQAFVEVAEDFPSSPAAGWAQHTAGSNYLQQGIEAMYRNRAEGEKLLSQAIEAFTEASESSKPDLQSKALYGLAQAHESLGELDKAAEYYERVSRSSTFPALIENAEQRLAYVTSEEGKNFYAWFDKLEPKPDAPIELPGNLSLPPMSPGDLQFDPIGDLGTSSTEEGAAEAETMPELNFDPADLPPLPAQDAPPTPAEDTPAPAADSPGEDAPAEDAPAQDPADTTEAEPAATAETPASGSDS